MKTLLDIAGILGVILIILSFPLKNSYVGFAGIFLIIFWAFIIAFAKPHPAEETD